MRIAAAFAGAWTPVSLLVAQWCVFNDGGETLEGVRGGRLEEAFAEA